MSLNSSQLLQKLNFAIKLMHCSVPYVNHHVQKAIYVSILKCSLLNYIVTCLLSCCSKGSIEPLLKSTDWLEDWGQQEVQKCPKLRQFVLKWGASEQQTVWGQVVCVQNLCQLAMMVLHTMTLINDHELPSQLQTYHGYKHLQNHTLTYSSIAKTYASYSHHCTMRYHTFQLEIESTSSNTY